MASRRMFHIDKIQTDAFLYLIPSAQCLFFHCMLTADDDGFVARPLALARMVGCSREDLDTLIREGFLIEFPDGVILIKHWRVHNCIRHDRYHASILPERKLIGWDETGEYHLLQERPGLTTFEDTKTDKPRVTPAPSAVETAEKGTIPSSLPPCDLKQLIAPTQKPDTEQETEAGKQPETPGSPVGTQWEPEVRIGKASPDYDRQDQSATLLSADLSTHRCAPGVSTDSGRNGVRPDGRTVTPGALQVLQQAFPHLRYKVLPEQEEA